VIEGAAVRTRTVVCTKELMPQVPVAVLHVHEVESGALRADSGPDEVAHEGVELHVREADLV
jgi:hypothetical protein